MCALLAGDRSFTELQTELETITPRMLSRRLHEFELVGVIAVRSERRPHRVYYHLTSGVRELREMLIAIQNWGRRLRS